MLPSTEQFPVEQLSVAERIALRGRQWDSLLDAGGMPPMPEWHALEIARRIARADAQPEPAIPLEQSRNELLGDTL